MFFGQLLLRKRPITINEYCSWEIRRLTLANGYTTLNENCSWQRERMVLHNVNCTLLRYTNHIWTMSTYIHLSSGWADVIFPTTPKDIWLIVSDLYSSDKPIDIHCPTNFFDMVGIVVSRMIRLLVYTDDLNCILLSELGKLGGS